MPDINNRAQQTNYQELTDAQLMERIQNRDTMALSELYDRYSPILFGLAIKILKNQMFAKDVLQDVFIQVWKNAGHYKVKQGKALAWMASICRNRCIDILRLKDTQTQRSAFEPRDLDHIRSLVSDERDSPLALANDEQLKELVKSALQKIPPEQRKLIEMAYYKGYSQSEIAEKTDTPLGTVKSRIRSGMLQLKEIFIRIGIKK
jgi:RNA polymerase sigma-70 factor (ECF subfamily)